MYRVACCVAIGVVALWLGTGCTTSASPVPPQAAPVDVETGNVIAFWVEYPHNGEPEKPTLVTGPYAAVMIWGESQRRFHLFESEARQMYRTGDFDAFLGQIDSLPRGVEIQRHDTCCGSLRWAMPPDARDRLRDVMESGNRKWSHNPIRDSDQFITCICDEGRVRFP